MKLNLKSIKQFPVKEQVLPNLDQTSFVSHLRQNLYIRSKQVKTEQDTSKSKEVSIILPVLNKLQSASKIKQGSDKSDMSIDQRQQSSVQSLQKLKPVTIRSIPQLEIASPDQMINDYQEQHKQQQEYFSEIVQDSYYYQSRKNMVLKSAKIKTDKSKLFQDSYGLKLQDLSPDMEPNKLFPQVSPRQIQERQKNLKQLLSKHKPPPLALKLQRDQQLIEDTSSMTHQSRIFTKKLSSIILKQQPFLSRISEQIPISIPITSRLSQDKVPQQTFASNNNVQKMESNKHFQKQEGKIVEFIEETQAQRQSNRCSLISQDLLIQSKQILQIENTLEENEVKLKKKIRDSHISKESFQNSIIYSMKHFEKKKSSFISSIQCTQQKNQNESDFGSIQNLLIGLQYINIVQGSAKSPQSHQINHKSQSKIPNMTLMRKISSSGKKISKINKYPDDDEVQSKNQSMNENLNKVDKDEDKNSYGNSSESEPNIETHDSEEYNIWDNLEIQQRGVDLEELNQSNKTEKFLLLYKMRYGMFPNQRENIDNSQVIQFAQNMSSGDRKLYLKYFGNPQKFNFQDHQDYSEPIDINNDNNYQRYLEYVSLSNPKLMMRQKKEQYLTSVDDIDNEIFQNQASEKKIIIIQDCQLQDVIKPQCTSSKKTLSSKTSQPMSKDTIPIKQSQQQKDRQNFQWIPQSLSLNANRFRPKFCKKETN